MIRRYTSPEGGVIFDHPYNDGSGAGSGGRSDLPGVARGSADLPISRTMRIRGTRQNVSTDHLRQNVQPARRSDSASTAPLGLLDMASAAYRSTVPGPR